MDEALNKLVEMGIATPVDDEGQGETDGTETAVSEQPPEPEAKAETKKPAPAAFEPLPVELPAGYKFTDLRQRHLIAYSDDADFSLQHKTKFHLWQHHIDAAVNAGWFTQPPQFTIEAAQDLHRDIAEMLYEAITSTWVNAVNTPKN